MVRRDFFEGMVDWAAMGRIVLLSSHQIPEVERVADVVAILHAGNLLLVERLDELKRQVQEVTLTAGEPQAAPPVGGELLRQRKKGRQWQMLVRHMPEDQIHRWQTDGGFEIVDVRTPSLEEIFVAYLERPADRTPATGGVEVASP
jgi:ABC-2 type transport system ATP-binding protein